MKRCAFLCGAAKEGFQQKKFSQMHERLLSEDYLEREITLFPNGVDELMLECALNGAFDSEADEIFLYFCARTEADLDSELADSYTSEVQAVRLGNDEVRKDVIEYYQGLCNRCDIDMQVVYDWDGDFVSQESLGWEKVVQKEKESFS